MAETYAYCLLKNHFHFLVKTRTDYKVMEEGESLTNKKISLHFSNFFNAYTKGFNKAYDRTGSLFEERFKRKEIDNQDYFTQLIHYIHANPQTHGLIDDFRAWPYSSYHSHLGEKNTKLQREEVLEWFGGRKEYKAFHEQAPLKKVDLTGF